MESVYREQLEALQDVLYDIETDQSPLLEDDVPAFDERPSYQDVGAAMRDGEARTHWDGDRLVDTFPADEDRNGYAWGTVIDHQRDGRYRITMTRSPALHEDEVARGIEAGGGLYGMLLMAAADDDHLHAPGSEPGDTYLTAVAEVGADEHYDSADAATIGVVRALIDDLLDANEGVNEDALDLVQVPALNEDDEELIDAYGLDRLRS